MNRRQFFGSAALAAASYKRVMGANDRLQMALIGSGRRGREVMGAFLKTGRAELQCICDVYDEHRQKAREVLAPAFECVGHEEALARPGIDAVLIGTPDHLHIDLACAALAAKKDVYLEKPTTHRFEEQNRLREAVKQSGKILQCGMQQRSGSHYIRAKQDIFDQNKLGKIVIVRTQWSDFAWQARNIKPRPQPAGLDWNRFLGHAPAHAYDWIRYDSWRYFPDYGNGLFADILTHWADVAQWMMNAKHPNSAATIGGIYALHDGRENPDTVNAVLEYDGWNLTFESSVLPLRDQRPAVTFLGTEGSLDITRERYVFTPNKGAAETVQGTGPLEIQHATSFLDAVRDRKQPSAPLEVGIEACNPVHLARAAYWKKKRVEWNEIAS
jgi:predicted dehydrogenase